MPGLLDLIQPRVTPISGGLLDPRLLESVGPGPMDMTIQPTAPAPMPVPQRPGLLGRVGNALFPVPDALGGLLSPEDASMARRQGLLDIGLSLLANSSPQNGQNAPPTLAAIAQALQAGRQGFQGGLGGALQTRQMAAQMAQQQQRESVRQQIAEQYAISPNDPPEAIAQKMRGMFASYVNAGDTEMVAKLNSVAPGLFEPTKAPAPVRGITTTVQGADGKPHAVLVNPVTGDRMADIGVVPKPSPADRPPTNQQELSGGYAARMVNAERNVRSLEDAGVTLPDKTLLFPPTSAKGMALYATLTPEQQQLYTFAGDWVAAKLRKESGATISDQEWASEMRRYFRAAGDRPEVAPTKRKLRGVANYGLVQQAGRAYDLDPADAGLVDSGRSTGQKPKAGGSDLYRKYNLTPPGGR